MNELSRTMGRAALPVSSTLYRTLLGTHAALLGSDPSGTVTVRQLLRRDEASNGFTSPQACLPVAHYAGHHPEVTAFQPGAVLPSTVLSFGISPQDRSQLEEGAEDVVTWVLVGLDPDDPADMDPLAPAQGGQGPFGLGADVQAAEKLALAEGRLWLRWEAASSEVLQPGNIPLVTTDSLGKEKRETLLALGAVVIDPISTAPTAPHASATALLSFDLNALLATRHTTYPLDDMQMLGTAVTQLANAVMEQQHGPDPAATAPFEPPSADSVLLDLATVGPLVVDGFRTDGVDTPSSLIDRHTGSLLESGTGTQTARYQEHFTLPADKGIKVTVRVGGGEQGSDRGFGLKLCRVGTPEEAAERSIPLLEFVDNSDAPWSSRVSTLVARTAMLAPVNSGVVLEDGNGVEVPAFRGQRYEVYIFPDRKAHVYVNGAFVALLRVNAAGYEAGATYTMVASVRDDQLQLDEARVEAFTLPADYAMESPVAPVIAAPDWTTVDNLDETALADGTSSVGFVLRRGADAVEFSLTEPAVFSMWAYLDNSPNDKTATVYVQAVDGTASYSESITSVNGWFTWPGTLPAGRYRASLDNYTFREYYVETDYITKWYYSCYRYGSTWKCRPSYKTPHLGGTVLPDGATCREYNTSGNDWKCTYPVERTKYRDVETQHKLSMREWKVETPS